MQLAHYLQPGSRPAEPDQTPVGRPHPGSRPPIDLDIVDLADTRLKPGWAGVPHARNGDQLVFTRDYNPEAELDQRGGRWEDDAGDVHDWSTVPGRRHGIQPTLFLWGRLVAEEMRDLDYQFTDCDDTLIDLCEWLAMHVEWIVEHHSDFPRAISGMYRDLRGDDEQHQIHSKCGFAIEEQDGGTWWRCTGCGRTWSRASEEAQMRREAENAVTLRYAAEQLGTPVKTLHDWASKGWISQLGRDRRGKLYSMRSIGEARARIQHGKRQQPGAS